MLNIEDVRIQARDLASAYRLAVEFGLGQEPRPFTMPIDSEGLVNATPMGVPGVQALSIDIGAMPATGWVFDMVTEPAATPLLSAARARGLQAIDGLAMLVEQAADSFHLLFGKDAPRQYDAELMQRLRP
jgi:shikimate dehydrogenase